MEEKYVKYAKFLPSFARQRSRIDCSDDAKFERERFLSDYSIKIEDLSSIFSAKEVVLEIGSGNGETASHFASLHPDSLYIACEVFRNGIMQTCGKAIKKDIQNIRFFQKDARDLLEKIKDQSCLDYIFLLFPDPWPKARHNKRRILTVDFLNLAKLSLKQNAKILVATDHDDYKLHIKKLGLEQNILSFSVSEQPAWWTPTKYQTKAEKIGSTIQFFEFTNF